MNVAKKLSKMDPVQAILAESLINNVLRQGLLKELNKNTDICNSSCYNTTSTPLLVSNNSTSCPTSFNSISAPDITPLTVVNSGAAESGFSLRDYYEDTGSNF